MIFMLPITKFKYSAALLRAALLSTSVNLKHISEAGTNFLAMFIKLYGVSQHA